MSNNLNATTYEVDHITPELIADRPENYFKNIDPYDNEQGWFSEKVILQSTYAPLIRILMCSQVNVGLMNQFNQQRTTRPF